MPLLTHPTQAGSLCKLWLIRIVKVSRKGNKNRIAHSGVQSTMNVKGLLSEVSYDSFGCIRELSRVPLRFFLIKLFVCFDEVI
jgi:hypothetical protein